MTKRQPKAGILAGPRVFRCDKCNYTPRLGQASCSYCFAPTPFYNRRWFWAVVVLAIAAALLSLAT